MTRWMIWWRQKWRDDVNDVAYMYDHVPIHKLCISSFNVKLDHEILIPLLESTLPAFVWPPRGCRSAIHHNCARSWHAAPADTCRNDNVIIASKRRFDAIMTILLPHVSAGKTRGSHEETAIMNTLPQHKARLISNTRGWSLRLSLQPESCHNIKFVVTRGAGQLSVPPVTTKLAS